MHYAKIKYYDISNGPGVRTSLFVSGCKRHCKGCFNQELWNFDYGEPFDLIAAWKVFDSCEPDYISGLSILGGEPMDIDNVPHITMLMRLFRSVYPKGKSIWCYSGYTFEELLHRDAATDYALGFVDVLVDGPFIEELHDISLVFRGSSNQRLIKVRESIAAGRPVLLTDEEAGKW